MNKYLLLKTITLILFHHTLMLSQTEISGGINQNTIWTKNNSPYVITSNTVIFGENTLTIEPGVIVKFDNDVQLRIQGSLIAEGTETENIIFTSNSLNPNKSSWKEINLEFMAKLTLDYTKIEYAESALKYNFIDTSSSIKNSIFENNTFGINVDSGRGQFPITISSTNFLNNDIGIANFHDEVSILNCEFLNNRIGAQLVESFVFSCLFEGNTERGLNGATSTILDSSFIANNIGLAQSFSGGSESSTMRNNTIKDNNIGLLIGGNNPLATFTNNTVCNNLVYNVESVSTFSGQNLSGNCWCTEDLNEIENSIFHGLDDINLGVINFTPLGTACPNSTTLSTNDFAKNIKQELIFYPNPFKDYIEFSKDSQNRYRIFSLDGKLMKSGTTNKKIDLVDLNKGIYLINIYYDNSISTTHKLIKN